jgi:hypothetical protein
LVGHGFCGFGELTWATLIEFWVAPGKSEAFSDARKFNKMRKSDNTFHVKKALPPAIYSTLPLLDSSSYLPKIALYSKKLCAIVRNNNI